MKALSFNAEIVQYTPLLAFKFVKTLKKLEDFSSHLTALQDYQSF
jgi:hypothetical protein